MRPLTPQQRAQIAAVRREYFARLAFGIVALTVGIASLAVLFLS